jgi:uncharacterized protein YndB with AHSA1/START domain
MVANSSRTVTVTLPSDLEIAMERTFDAPRALVFEAFTKAEHMRHWWGFKESTFLVCEFDARPGGAWRMVSRGADGGPEHGFRGEIREFVPPERFTWTFEWEGLPGHISVETMSFEEQDGKTTYRSLTRFDTVEDRDGMLQTGMADGANESFEQLDAYLKTLA